MPSRPSEVNDDAAPLISVIIPTYRRSAKIAVALASALGQTVDDLEVVVVDDASGDDTEQIVAAIGDARIRYVQHRINQGANAARRTGIQVSGGHYLAFLDSDDTWAPAKLERQLELLHRLGPGFGMCTTWLRAAAADGTRLFDLEPRLRGIAVPELLIADQLGGFSSVLIDRATLDRVGGPDPGLRACQDWDLFLRVNAATGLCIVEEHLVSYCLDVDDPVRISTDRAAVRAGHRHIYAMVRARLGQLDPCHQAAAWRSFMGLFAALGAPSDVVRVVADVRLNRWTSDLARHAAHMLARSVRKAAYLGNRTHEWTGPRARTPHR